MIYEDFSFFFFLSIFLIVRDRERVSDTMLSKSFCSLCSQKAVILYGCEYGFFLKYLWRVYFSSSDSCEIQPPAAWDAVFLGINGFLKIRTLFFFKHEYVLYVNCEVMEPVCFYLSSVPPMQGHVRRFPWLLSGSRSMLPCVCMT